MITVKRRDRSLTHNVSLFKRIPDTVARGSADIDHVEEQSDLTPVPVPHHAGAHQAHVDAPAVKQSCSQRNVIIGYNVDFYTVMFCHGLIGYDIYL